MKHPSPAPLDEIAERILAELEEAGSENIFTLVNTIFPPQGVASEVARLRTALENLRTLGLVEIEFWHGPPRGAETLPPEAADALIHDLAAWFRFDHAGPYWTLREGDLLTVKAPEIALTPSGWARSRELLGRRGYQWWRHPPPRGGKLAERAVPEVMLKIGAAFHQDVFVLNATLEEAVTEAIADLTPAERAEAKSFLEALLADGEAPGAVRRVWRRMEMQITSRNRAGMAAFFAVIRDRL